MGRGGSDGVGAGVDWRRVVQMGWREGAGVDWGRGGSDGVESGGSGRLGEGWFRWGGERGAGVDWGRGGSDGVERGGAGVDGLWVPVCVRASVRWWCDVHQRKPTDPPRSGGRWVVSVRGRSSSVRGHLATVCWHGNMGMLTWIPHQ